MNIVFTRYAKLEFIDAINYYDKEAEGLGKRFKHEVLKSIKRIHQYPVAWSIEQDGVRKFFLHKFPYKILYSIEQNHILILAVAHQHRKPDYWVDRDNA